MGQKYKNPERFPDFMSIETLSKKSNPRMKNYKAMYLNDLRGSKT